MSKTITLRIWNEDECKVSKTVEVANVLSVEFETKYKEITFTGDNAEILIVPHLNDIEFKFSEDKEYVFINIKDCEEQ